MTPDYGYLRKGWLQKVAIFILSLTVQILVVRWFWLKNVQEFIEEDRPELADYWGKKFNDRLKLVEKELKLKNQNAKNSNRFAMLRGVLDEKSGENADSYTATPTTLTDDVEESIMIKGKKHMFKPEKLILPTVENGCEPVNLQGRLNISLDGNAPSFQQTADQNSQMEQGVYTPSNCNLPGPGYKVAIIIPFRDITKDKYRTEHLKWLLHYMIPILIRQNIMFSFYIINQGGDRPGKRVPFNRAKLLNIGYKEAEKNGFDCFMFHDVDLILEDDRCIYACQSENPRHYSVGIDKYKYQLPYWKIFGGITQMNKDQFVKINGYSNEFWGWGGEDDDMQRRVTIGGKMTIRRPPFKYAKYTMIHHKKETTSNPKNPRRKPLVDRWKFKDFVEKQKWMEDGLNSLSYDVIGRRVEACFINITVDLHYNERIRTNDLFNFKGPAKIPPSPAL